MLILLGDGEILVVGAFWVWAPDTATATAMIANPVVSLVIGESFQLVLD